MGEIQDLHGLVGLARRLLEANKDRVGTVTTARGAQVWVDGRRPCGLAPRAPA